MKKPKLRRIKSKLSRYQERLENHSAILDDAFEHLDSLYQQVSDMKQALIRRDQELDSWRDLLAEMQVEISQLRAATPEHPAMDRTIVEALKPAVVRKEPDNGFGWWKRVFGRKPAPPEPTLEGLTRADVGILLAELKELQSSNPRR